MIAEKQIKKIDALIEKLKSIKTELKRRKKMIGRECHTPNQYEKKSADISWSNMGIIQSVDESHALCVELGLSDLRSSDRYEDGEFFLGPLHKYKRTKRMPVEFALSLC